MLNTESVMKSIFGLALAGPLLCDWEGNWVRGLILILECQTAYLWGVRRFDAARVLNLQSLIVVSNAALVVQVLRKALKVLIIVSY